MSDHPRHHADVQMAAHLRAEHGWSWTRLKRKYQPWYGWTWFREAVEYEMEKDDG